MTLRIHDTLTRQKRKFQPVEEGRVGLYVCGPTVYDDCHIGHLMGPILFDAVARWLRCRGFEVRFVNNITDIDDKIIRRAQETGSEWNEVADKWTNVYLGYLTELGIETITDHPRCTEYVPQMVEFVEKLVRDDRAYVAGDGVYYEIAKQQDYGKLSGRHVEDMQSGARIEAADGLRHPADFALWKLSKEGEPSWPSPWGEGRPGWHLECSVMSTSLLGSKFDIHGGGDDLKFPHHENEIAQSEAHGDSYAQIWMHNGLVQYGGKKVAKSDPRFNDPEFSQQFMVRWLIDTYGAPTLRFFLQRGHYRRPVDFAPENVEGARTGLLRLIDKLGELAEEPSAASLDDVLAREVPAGIAALRQRFVDAMDDDFGTGEALAALFSMQKEAAHAEVAERETILRTMRDLGRLLGHFQPGDRARVEGAGQSSDEAVTALVDGLLDLREKARAEKDFARSDALRNLLNDSGVEVHDGRERARSEAASSCLDPLMERLIALRTSSRANKDFATADALRDLLDAAGLELHDGAEGRTWARR